MKIRNITCEFMPEPLAVTAKQPRFSWEIVSEEHGIRQTSWKIAVRDRKGNTVWDSGETSGENSTGILYQGEKLRSASQYEYQITVGTNTKETVTSRPQIFETAFYSVEDWKARWIEPNPLPQLAERSLTVAQREWDDILDQGFLLFSCGG
ncbi:MAG: hypothetical protein LUI87_19590 [Lachnospiraceae bacterium]|nr:hypothetical protein [Lachnospiraceae bacterium]